MQTCAEDVAGGDMCSRGEPCVFQMLGRRVEQVEVCSRYRLTDGARV
jgi:hypothetical protein